MNVYYRRITTWQKWPDNDLIDEDYVSYSLSKKKWNEFYRTPPLADVTMGIKLVSEQLRIKSSKVNLVNP